MHGLASPVIDPDSLRVSVIVLVLLVAGFDLGIAFVMRTAKEAAGAGGGSGE